MARGREAAAARQVGRCELQQLDGEEEVKAKLQGGVGGGATTGAKQQPAGKQEANGRGGLQEANRRGGVSGQEAAECREDKVRRHNNQPEAPLEPPPPPPPPPRKIPSGGGGSDVSRVVCEFGIGEIHASTVVVANPLTLLPFLSPLSV